MKTRKVGKVKAVIFLLIPLIILLVVCEVLSSVYLHSRFDHFDLGIQGRSTMIHSGYQVWQHPNNYTSWSKKTHFNNLGFKRFENTSEKKESGVIRIFILGGSTALGSQAMPGSVFLKLSGQGEYSADLTISGYLERLLTENYPNRRFEVINGAMVSTLMHQQMLHYYRKIRSLEPDLIISIDGQNDSHPIDDRFLNMWDLTEDSASNIWGDLKYRLTPLFSHSNFAYLTAMLAFRPGGAPSVNKDLIEKYMKIGRPKDYEAVIERYYAENRESVDRSVNEYLYNLTHFDAALQKDNVPHLLLLQPQTIMDTTKVMTKEERALQGYMFSRLEHQKFRINFFRKVEQKGKLLRETQGLSFGSLQNIFPGEGDNVYTDYCHLTPLGNKLVAARLLTLIEEAYPALVREEQ